MSKLAAAACAAVSLCACARPAATPAPQASTSEIAYPDTPRGEQVDEYFGVRVADPYRWLEELDAPEVGAWVEAQNRISKPLLESLPRYAQLKERLDALWSYEHYTAPKVRAGRYFFEYNDGRSTLNRLVVADGLEGRPAVVLDPALLSPDGTTLLSGWDVSPDGRMVAWSAAAGGSDWDVWRIRRVDTGEDYPEVLEGTKFTSAEWLPDSTGFFYSRYPRKDGGWDDQQQVQVWLHRVGTPQAEDTLVYSVTDHPTRVPYGEVSSDGAWLIVSVYQDSRTNGLFALPLDRPEAAPVPVVASWNGVSDYLGTAGGRFYVNTNVGAPNGRLVAIDPARPAQDRWTTVVPESELAIDDADLVGERLIVQYLQDAKSRVETFGLDGSPRGPVALPGPGKVEGFDGDPDKDETFFTFESFTNPGAVVRYRPATGTTQPYRQSETVLATDELVTEQVFYTSRDGTRVPMFLVHRKGMVRDGSNPVLLYGYGGFNVPQLPTFDLRWAGWLDMGGVLAVAIIRGGGEYGSEWHAAGTRENKQNVFDDFIAAAEWLIDKRITSTPKLAINGRSNGGLLVGAVQTQRPELFGVATPIVGVLDMLRYHTPSANARAWSGDYGLSENERDFRAQYAYSPVHNVKPGTCYPPTLIQTADKDDRVVPWHSYKFAAALQHAQGCDNPILLRVETRAGHGSADSKPRWMRIEELAERYAFIAYHMNM